MYCAKRLQVNTMLRAATHDHYSKMVEDNNHNSEALFKVSTSCFIGISSHFYQRVALPSSLPQTSMSSCPLGLRQSTPRWGKLQIHSQRLMTQDLLGAALSHFRPATEKEVHKLLMSPPCKSCELDPFPTWLPKKCAVLAVPLLTHLSDQRLTFRGMCGQQYQDSSRSTHC